MSGRDLESESQASTLVGVALGFIISSGVLVILRLYTRVFMLRNCGLDDWGIIVAMASLTRGYRGAQYQAG